MPFAVALVEPETVDVSNGLEAKVRMEKEFERLKLIEEKKEEERYI